MGLAKEAGFNPQFNLLEKLDTNQDGRITWDEFEANLRCAVETVVEKELAADEKALERLKQLFQSLDANADQAVSKDELAEGLSDVEVVTLVKDAGFNLWLNVFKQLDTNADGRITWDEFEAQLRGAAREQVKAELEVPVACVALQEQDEVVDGTVAPMCSWCGF